MFYSEGKGVQRSEATSGDRSALLVATLDAFAGASTGAGLAAIACGFWPLLNLLGICTCTGKSGRPVKGAPWPEFVVLRCSAEQKACAPLLWAKTDDMSVPHFSRGQTQLQWPCPNAECAGLPWHSVLTKELTGTQWSTPGPSHRQIIATQLIFREHSNL